MKNIIARIKNYWQNLGAVRVPLLILIAALLILICVLTALLLAKPPEGTSSARLVASIIVPVELVEPQAKHAEEDHTEQAAGAALSPAPDPALLEDNPVGPLPKRDASGRAPWQAYARPFDISGTQPLIALIVTDMGLNSAMTEKAIHDLPPDATLSFSPYAQRLSSWADKARQSGFETLLVLPMEPAAYPQNDPGPQTLLTGLSAEENVRRLYWTLSRINGPVGVVNAGGTVFTRAEPALKPILNELNARGLLFIDDASNDSSSTTLIATDLRMPFARISLHVDQALSREAIQKNFQALIEQAKANGTAIGIISPTPLALEQIRQFSASLPAAGVMLAPVSAIVQKTSAPAMPASPVNVPAQAPEAPAVETDPALITPKAISPSVAPSFVAPKLPEASNSTAITPPSSAPADITSIAPPKQETPAAPTTPGDLSSMTPKAQDKSHPQTSIAPH